MRIIRGYDEYNTILLPPRGINEKLPIELYDFYEEQIKKLEEEEKKQKELLLETINSAENTTLSTADVNNRQVSAKSENSPQQVAVINKVTTNAKEMLNGNSVGDLEKNPVFDSIARYLGIDLTSEGRAARNRRGVAIIVHGPPLCGKSRAAVALAKHYEGALLTIDSIIIDALSNSSSSAAAKARQLCAEAAAKHAEEARALEAINEAQQQPKNTTVAGGGVQGSIATQGLSVEALAQHSINRKLFSKNCFVVFQFNSN